MFAAFEGQPLIFRIYAQARVIHHSDPEWDELYAMFTPLPGARQIFDLSIDMVQSSCGKSVPFFDYVGEREALSDWARERGDTGIADYWRRKNHSSIDGLATHIVEKNIDTLAD